MSKQRIHFVVEDARIRRSFKEEKTYRLRRDERVRVAEEGIRRDSVGHFFAFAPSSSSAFFGTRLKFGLFF